MNKQIEQVETIMTKHAERVCIKRKKTKLEQVLSNFFFKWHKKNWKTRVYTINEEESILSNFWNVENPETLTRDFTQFIAYPYKLECHKHFASWSHYQHHLSHMKGQNLWAVQERNDVQTN